MVASNKPRLIFAKKNPPLWKCSECAKEYQLGSVSREGMENRLDEIEREFEGHVRESHPPTK
jgi:hypothetical protein